jgi:hypothetical protein
MVRTKYHVLIYGGVCNRNIDNSGAGTSIKIQASGKRGREVGIKLLLLLGPRIISQIVSQFQILKNNRRVKEERSWVSVQSNRQSRIRFIIYSADS